MIRRPVPDRIRSICRPPSRASHSPPWIPGVGRSNQAVARSRPTARRPSPREAPGLVDELRARDWITADGEITPAGRHALSRWLDAGA